MQEMMEKKNYLSPTTEVFELELQNMIAISPGSWDPDGQQDSETIVPGEGSTVKPID